jgi:DNA repair protein RecN (Recombination protein N)
MILSLKISNFILVKDLELNFANGLNVITGETGTGKSVIIGAINAIFDKKTKKMSYLMHPKKPILKPLFP